MAAAAVVVAAALLLAIGELVLLVLAERERRAAVTRADRAEGALRTAEEMLAIQIAANVAMHQGWRDDLVNIERGWRDCAIDWRDEVNELNAELDDLYGTRSDDGQVLDVDPLDLDTREIEGPVRVAAKRSATWPE
jgi:hypothetical protein